MAIVAAATIGGALLSSRSQSKATEAASKGQDKALAASSAGATSATRDVNRLFGTAQDARAGGFQSALDFLGGSVGQQVAPFQQGNVLAQQQISRGLPQIQNALLGLPTDLSGFQPQQIGQPSDFNIPIPQAAQPQQPQFNLPPFLSGGFLGTPFAQQFQNLGR